MWVGGPKEGALLCDYPLQSLRLRLSGVEPSKAAWNQEAVDFLHCTFVDQEVTVDTSHCEDMGDIGAICTGTVATLTGQDAATLLIKHNFTTGLQLAAQITDSQNYRRQGIIDVAFELADTFQEVVLPERANAIQD